jgi:outer membrane protein assembly factor BamD (BamD/ComL family)
MHYRVAANLEKAHRYGEAKDYFLRLYEERQAAVITGLALLRICQLEVSRFDREKALGYMERYIDEYAEGTAREEILMLHIQTCLAERKLDRAIPYMVQFVGEYPASAFADYIAFNLAQIFRTDKKELSNAMKYYEFITDNFPESSFHEDALYWAGWCLVQEQVHGKKNKYFRKYKKDYPRGNWTDVISNK